MRIMVALGGNALLRRGQKLTVTAQRENVRTAATALAGVGAQGGLIITHGNGPQIGLLALQTAGHHGDEVFPLDVLGAETEGMIGYMIEQELRNRLPHDTPIATMLTMVEVDPDDPAFHNPTKFIGPIYTEAEAQALATANGWSVRQDGTAWRRVVASPEARRIIDIRPLEWLLERGAIVIAAGGGGIPIIRDEMGQLRGSEAVIDKDLCAAMLARELCADLLVLATDVDAVYHDWGAPTANAIRQTTPDELASQHFPAGSMGPKVDAACRFVTATGKPAAIGALADLAALLRGAAGTWISPRTCDQAHS